MSVLSRALRPLVSPRTPRELSARFRDPSGAGHEALEAALRENFFSRRPAGFLESAAGRKALHDHLGGRVAIDRQWIVPWLASVRPLDGLKILEVGCGTGSSTLALAEQGPRVTAMDLDEGSLTVARTRLEVHGLEARFVQGNVIDFRQLFGTESFDLILFFASIEHMLHEERMAAMRESWAALSPGSLWGIVDTPNRIWWLDAHTSFLPFFQWLPDDLAQKYARFSPRGMVNGVPEGDTEARRTEFLRLGRGVSYHEFELAMKPLPDLRVRSCMRLFHRDRLLLRKWKRRFSFGGRYEALLARAAPHVPHAFLLPSLDLLLEKD